MRAELAMDGTNLIVTLIPENNVEEFACQHARMMAELKSGVTVKYRHIETPGIPELPQPDKPKDFPEVLAFAEMGQGIPGGVCEAFFNHYEGNGWVDGQSRPVANWKAKLRSWWVKHQAEGKGDGPRLSGADTIKFQKELDRIIGRMQTIRNQYDSHQRPTDEDKAELRKLKKRFSELKKLLGVEI